MTAIFLGGIKNLLQNNKKTEHPVSRITENLSKSSFGLHKTQLSGNSDSSTKATVSSSMDSFDITKTVSDLLSPACGMTEEEKTTYFNKIMGKLKSGKKLTPEEMRFLQAEYPALYQQAARVQAMREGLETRLKACHSKEEAQTMFADALSHVSDDDPMKEAITASYMDAMNEFQKSDEYRELPDTAEEAEYGK